MTAVETLDLGTPTEVRTFHRGRLEIYRVGGQTFARAHYEPGWHWREDASAGDEWCSVHHVGFALSGALRIRLTDGTETVIESGRAYSIPPGHDGTVVSDEPWTTIDYVGPAS